jgi:ATP-dependent Clp protease ATP-binding subunit ClpA
MKIRDEIIAEILKVNIVFEPTNLIINRNHVVKLKSGKLGDGEKLLTDNKNWNVSYYDESDGMDPNTGENIGASEEMKDIEELEFAVVKQWWKRINQYIEIKKFMEKDMESILSKKYFHNRSSFQTFIVSLCVVNSEELFIMLDTMGIPNRVAPPILMHEVYDLCKGVNPFLTYENAQALMGDQQDEDQGYNQGDGSNNQTSMVGQAKKQKHKKKLKFKNVSKKDLLSLGEAMKVSLVGQDEAVGVIVDTIQRASVGLKDPIKPIGSFLFAGKTGCGKSLSAKVLANELIKEKRNLVTIDCSEYSSDHEYSKLIGSPAGYIGYDQGGYLTNAVIESPFSVVVFDEIEKASSKVHELLLQIMDEGRLTDGKGKSVSFKNTIIIMTSNVGVKEVKTVQKTIGFGDAAKLTDDKQDKAIHKAIKNKFKPEFLNRIDSIVNFKPLTKKDYMRIIDIELYRLNDNLRHNATEYKKCELTFGSRVKGFIFKKGINEEYGARPLKRCIEKEIATPLARKLLKENITPDSKIMVDLLKGKVNFKVETKVKEAVVGDLGALTRGAKG